jgi:hypothetical protein
VTCHLSCASRSRRPHVQQPLGQSHLEGWCDLRLGGQQQGRAVRWKDASSTILQILPCHRRGRTARGADSVDCWSGRSTRSRRGLPHRGAAVERDGGAFAGVSWDQNPAASVSTPDDQTRQRVIPFEYSDGYRTRAKIHKLASIATLPLFVTEGFLGQSLYDNPTSGKRTAHLAVAAAIAGLFAVNTVTGVWNLVEARKDPHGRTRRLAHGILMLAADAGFLATAATGPGHEHEEEGSVEGSRSTHRAIAFTSIGLATAGYLIMLLGGR